MLYTVLAIMALLITMLISIGLHEAGHMFAAKKLGVAVPRYFIGFGPTIWSKKKNGTEYGFKLFPIGGFVEIHDETQPAESIERKLLSNVAPWKRIVIFMAGPAVNLVLGFVILMGVLMSFPTNQITTTIGTVSTCVAATDVCNAQKAGFQAGDTILKIKDIPITDNAQVSSSLAQFKGQKIDFLVKRGEAEMVLSAVQVSDLGKIGINLSIVKAPLTFNESIGVFNAVWGKTVESMAKIPESVGNIWNSLWGTETRNPEGVSSIIGLGSAYVNAGATAEEDSASTYATWILYAALLNLGLFLGNLLPFAPLDGGKIVLASIDQFRSWTARILKRKYTPLSVNAIASFSAVTAALVVPILLLFLVADIFVPLVY